MSLYWQHQLRCYVENGGGAHCYRKELWRKWKRLSLSKNQQLHIQATYVQLCYFFSVQYLVYLTSVSFVSQSWKWIVDLFETQICWKNKHLFNLEFSDSFSLQTSYGNIKICMEFDCHQSILRSLLWLHFSCYRSRLDKWGELTW